jgi:hypothetical protein
MLLFVQFVQVMRAMTTYENMFGVDHHLAASLNTAFTSTGAPLDPSRVPPSGAPAPAGHGHHGHKHGQGFLKQWGKLLGVDAFIETATGRGAATSQGGGRGGRRSKGGANPYSRGCVTNCKDFWCDPAPVFGRRETGMAVLGGHVVNYTDMYEKPTGMSMPSRGRRTGGYEEVAAEEHEEV